MEAVAAVVLAAMAVMLAIAARRMRLRPEALGGNDPPDDAEGAGVREPRPPVPQAGSAVAEVDSAQDR